MGKFVYGTTSLRNAIPACLLHKEYYLGFKIAIIRFIYDPAFDRNKSISSEVSTLRKKDALDKIFLVTKFMKFVVVFHIFSTTLSLFFTDYWR